MEQLQTLTDLQLLHFLSESLLSITHMKTLIKSGIMKQVSGPPHKLYLIFTKAYYCTKVLHL